jgi:hypothetical protein
MRQTMLLITGLIATILIAAGCGDDARPSSTKTTATAAPSTPRAVDPPTPDSKLTKALGDTATKLTSAGCELGSYQLDDADHVDVDEDLKSTSFPPTSGRHYSDWAPFGLYDEPIPDGNAIHNMEHGGVVVWLGTQVDEPTTTAIADLLDDGEKWVVAPRPDIEGLFASAWGLGLSCSPAALATLGPDDVAAALDTWYENVESTGSPAEKDVPSYAGAMKEPTPVKDISTDAPF